MAMVIPVSQHKLIKIRKKNRIKLTKIALCCSTAGCLCNLVGSSTNNWIYTSEVLKYYVLPNITQNFDYELLANQPVYFKNATMGPWKFCWLDPITEFNCHPVHYLVDDDPSDVTTSVQQTVRRGFIFMALGVFLDVLGAIVGALCSLRVNPYATLLCSSIVHIFAGIFNFLCILVYMAAVSKEVGNKIYPASEMDDPLFHYSYGFSFILLKCSFLLTQTAALLTVVVFMAKRDERTFHRYKLRSLMNFKKIDADGTLRETTPEPAPPTHGPARFNSIKHRSSCCEDEDRPEMDDIISLSADRRMSNCYRKMSTLTLGPGSGVPFFMQSTLQPGIGNKGLPRFPVERKISPMGTNSTSTSGSPTQEVRRKIATIML